MHLASVVAYYKARNKESMLRAFYMPSEDTLLIADSFCALTVPHPQQRDFPFFGPLTPTGVNLRVPVHGWKGAASLGSGVNLRSWWKGYETQTAKTRLALGRRLTEDEQTGRLWRRLISESTGDIVNLPKDQLDMLAPYNSLLKDFTFELLESGTTARVSHSGKLCMVLMAGVGKTLEEERL